MKSSVTITFTALFVGVAVFYYFFAKPASQLALPGAAAPQKTEGEVVAPDRLLPFDKETPIHWIQIQKPSEKETVTLGLKDGQWYIKYPIVYATDSVVAQGLLTALKVSHKARRMRREKDWSEYGLSVPDIKIGVEAQGSSKRYYLLLGDYSPVADMVYARWEGEEEYFLLDARFKAAYDRSVYSLREKRICRIPLRKLEKIHVQSLSGNYEIAQKDGKWYWTEPVSEIGRNVSKEDTYEILMMLRDLNIKEFLDNEPYKGPKQGFVPEAPYFKLTGDNRTLTFRLGNEIPQHNAYYGVIDDEKIPLEVAKPNIENFFKVFDSIGEVFRKERRAAMVEPSAAPSLTPSETSTGASPASPAPTPTPSMTPAAPQPSASPKAA